MYKFEDALKELKEGKAITREEWIKDNSKIHLELNGADVVMIETSEDEEGNQSQNISEGFFFSSDSVLATDWLVMI